MDRRRLISDKLFIYLITIYFVGVILGVVLVNPKNLTINFEKKNYFSIFFSNYWYIFLIWIFGFSIISYITTTFILFFRAFIFGILIRTLISNFHQFILMIFIELVFALPILIFVSYISLSISKAQFGIITNKYSTPINYKKYINLMLIITALVVIYSLIIFFN